MNNLDQIIYNNYKVDPINSVTGTQPYLYTIGSLGYYLNTILLYVNHKMFKITLITLDFHTMDNN